MRGITNRAGGLGLTILLVALFAAVAGGALVVATSREPESRAASAKAPARPAAAKVVDSGASRSSFPELEKVAGISTLRAQRAARKRRTARRARSTPARPVAEPTPGARSSEPEPASTPSPRPVSTPAPQRVAPAPQRTAPAPRPQPQPQPRSQPRPDPGQSFDSSGESFDSSG